MLRFFKNLWIVLAFLSATAASPARADMAKFEGALALFNEAALWRDGGLPGGGATFPTGGVYRFNSGLRVHIGGASTSVLRDIAERQTRLAAEIAGLSLEIVDAPKKRTSDSISSRNTWRRRASRRPAA
jgi:hypothetical protein